MPNCRQIASAVPRGSSRWRGTVARRPVGPDQTSCRRPWRSNAHAWAVRWRTRSRRLIMSVDEGGEAVAHCT